MMRGMKEADGSQSENFVVVVDLCLVCWVHFSYETDY
jgi:hypothetical protein